MWLTVAKAVLGLLGVFSGLKSWLLRRSHVEEGRRAEQLESRINELEKKDAQEAAAVDAARGVLGDPASRAEWLRKKALTKRNKSK
jgi:hypothetical protein